MTRQDDEWMWPRDATPSGGGISGAAPGANLPLPNWLAAADHVDNNTSGLKP